MKKIIALFAAVLMAGSMMAEDVTVVTPPADATYEVYAASSYISGAFYSVIKWNTTIAIKEDKMYLKGVIPYSENNKWIVGTISGNEVVFASGQFVGDVDAGDLGYLPDCGFYGADPERMELKSVAIFSWNPTNKVLQSIDPETIAYCASKDVGVFYFNGTIYPGDPLTYRGTGKAPSALENTTAEVKTVKTIENGQLIIDVNGVRYDVLGKMLK